MAATAVLCGCQTTAYYAQAIRGQTALLVNQTSVERLLAEPKTPPALRDHLRLAGDLCQFARDELHLKVDGNYRRYVEVGRKFVVWNVEAAPEFSLEARRWWYPFVGRLSYRGFFVEASARACARELEHDGLDVMIGGVPAYSTLGWFRDPLLSTFLSDPEAELAETIFHELAHEKVFARGDTDYNEAFATSVGEEGVRRWFRARRDEAAARAYEASRLHLREFSRLVARARDQLAALYGDELSPEGTLRATTRKQAIPRSELRREKARILAELKADYARARESWGTDAEYDAWFAAPLNNARLNSVATYYDLVPGFERLLAADGGDLDRFYQTAQRWSKSPKAERRHVLDSPKDPTP